MILVSDTTPLNYLILIGEVEIIPELYERLLAPEAVLRELGHARSPAEVRAWAAAPPQWVEIRTVTVPDDPALAAFDAGEREALALAQEVGADLVLVDEHAAREEGKRRGLRIIGTLGVLDTAAERGLTDFAAAIEGLRRTTFYFKEDLVAPLLAKHPPK